MTPAQRAINCTAIGQLSALPKWEWLPGMREIAELDNGVTHSFSHRIGDDGLPALHNGQPDFADNLTLHGLLFLVCRAWAGHNIEIMQYADGSCRIEISAPRGTHAEIKIDLTGSLADVLVNVLEAAP